MKSILIVDTEGSPLLTQVSVLDLNGNVVYEATTPDFPTADTWQPNLRSRSELLPELAQVITGNTLIFHSAEHDLKVLRASYKKEGLEFPRIESNCTYELAKKYLPGMSSYSLANLSQKLHLTVNNKRFDSSQAHSARYDALFTHQLYLKIESSLKDSANPFGSSRVDTPFQSHPDFEGIYRAQFQVLEEIVKEIHLDPNHQSKGSVVIGDPGSGKTHLMMRLAQRLRTNRLFFIRQPNNADTIQYHIYSRILESLVEKVPGSTYTQLEYLLANTLIHIILDNDRTAPKLRETIEGFRDNPLELFTKLGGDGTDIKRNNWKKIEKHTLTWWEKNYGIAGYADKVLQGFIKYCGYSDPDFRKLIMQWLAANELSQEDLRKVDLMSWSENLSREEFALEAISAIAKLSLLDEPLIIVFDQLEALFLEHNSQLLLNFGEAVKEIFTHAPNSLIIVNLFPDRWERFQQIFDGAVVDRVSQYQVVLERPNDEQLKGILAKKAGCQLNELFTTEEQTWILQGPSIRSIINRAGDYYRYKFKGIPLPSSPAPVPPVVGQDFFDHVNTALANIQQQLQQILDHLGLTLQTEVEIPTQNDTEVEDLDLDLDLESVINSPTPSEVTSAVSISREVLIIQEYLQDKRQTLEKEYEKPRIIADSDDIGKFWDIARAFNHCQGNIDLDVLNLARKKLPDHLLCTVKNKKTCVGFCNVDGNAFTARIQNWNQLVINNSDIQFKLYRDGRQNTINGKVGKQEIEKLNHSKNGSFTILEKSERIAFDLISELVTDINNRDLEVDISKGLNTLKMELSDCFVFRAFG